METPLCSLGVKEFFLILYSWEVCALCSNNEELLAPSHIPYVLYWKYRAKYILYCMMATIKVYAYYAVKIYKYNPPPLKKIKQGVARPARRCWIRLWFLCAIRRDYFIIPPTTSCGGYNVFDPSVSQSVSISVSQVIQIQKVDMFWETCIKGKSFEKLLVFIIIYC